MKNTGPKAHSETSETRGICFDNCPSQLCVALPPLPTSLMDRGTTRFRTMSTQTLPASRGECKMILKSTSESFRLTAGYSSEVGGIGPHEKNQGLPRDSFKSRQLSFHRANRDDRSRPTAALLPHHPRSFTSERRIARPIGTPIRNNRAFGSSAVRSNS